MRTRDWRRFQTEKVIQKRLKIIKVWCSGSSEIGSHTKFVRTREFKNPGILKKWNLTCGCGCCKIDRKGYYNDKQEKKTVSFEEEYGSIWSRFDYNNCDY